MKGEPGKTPQCGIKDVSPSAQSIAKHAHETKLAAILEAKGGTRSLAVWLALDLLMLKKASVGRKCQHTWRNAFGSGAVGLPASSRSRLLYVYVAHTRDK